MYVKCSYSFQSSTSGNIFQAHFCAKRTWELHHSILLRIQFIVYKRMFHYLIIHKLFKSSHQHADMMDWNNFMLFTILIAFYFIVYLLSSTHFMSRHSVIISFVPYHIFFLCFHCKPSIDSGANSFKAYLSNYIRTNLSFTSCFFYKGFSKDFHI